MSLITVPLTAGTDRLFDSVGRCGSYVGPDIAFFWSYWDSRERGAPRLEVLRGGVAHKLQILHLSWQILLWTNNISARIELVLWAGLSGDEPCQCCTFFTVLILHKASNLSVVRLPVFFICYLNHVSYLVVYTLIKYGF